MESLNLFLQSKIWASSYNENIENGYSTQYHLILFMDLYSQRKGDNLMVPIVILVVHTVRYAFMSFSNFTQWPSVVWQTNIPNGKKFQHLQVESFVLHVAHGANILKFEKHGKAWMMRVHLCHWRYNFVPRDKTLQNVYFLSRVQSATFKFKTHFQWIQLE